MLLSIKVLKVVDYHRSLKIKVRAYAIVCLTEDSRQESPSGDAWSASAEVDKDEADMTDEERIAALGKPKLGDIVEINVHIRESIEFKVRTHIRC